MGWGQWVAGRVMGGQEVSDNQKGDECLRGRLVSRKPTSCEENTKQSPGRLVARRTLSGQEADYWQKKNVLSGQEGT